mmetsp:Transcript_43282/g.93988  ORF Transcript_43282/g.93988 Transcript_43282/m.93988 type:complete len:89 (+) Transcript_43282:116-382(+)
MGMGWSPGAALDDGAMPPVAGVTAVAARDMGIGWRAGEGAEAEVETAETGMGGGAPGMGDGRPNDMLGLGGNPWGPGLMPDPMPGFIG